MKTLGSRRSLTRSLAALGALGLALGAAQSARAVTLEQKWLAGQQLTYDMTLGGTLLLDTEAGAPVLWAGLPLEVLVKANGEVALDTRSVDETGAGLVAFTLPSFKITGTAWEQKAVLAITDGKSNFSFNGKQMNGPKDKQPDLRFLVEPSYGLQISKTGHVKRALPLAAPLDKDAETPDAKNTPEVVPDTKDVPLNIAGLLRSAMLQMLPAPWPDHDVEVGETWTIKSRLPIPAANADDVNGDATGDAAAGNADDATPKPPFQVLDLGKFDMTLKGEEDLDGQKTMRVAVQGILSVDAAKAATLNKAFGDKTRGAAISSMTQKFSGDLWFDAEAGRLVKAALVLKGQLKNVNSTPAKDGAKGKSWNSTQSFNGNIGLKLKEVSMAPIVAEAPVTAEAPVAADENAAQ